MSDQMKSNTSNSVYNLTNNAHLFYTDSTW